MEELDIKFLDSFSIQNVVIQRVWDLESKEFFIENYFTKSHFDYNLFAKEIGNVDIIRQLALKSETIKDARMHCDNLLAILHTLADQRRIEQSSFMYSFLKFTQDHSYVFSIGMVSLFFGAFYLISLHQDFVKLCSTTDFKFELLFLYRQKFEERFAAQCRNVQHLSTAQQENAEQLANGIHQLRDAGRMLNALVGDVCVEQERVRTVITKLSKALAQTMRSLEKFDGSTLSPEVIDFLNHLTPSQIETLKVLARPETMAGIRAISRTVI